jgi:adenylylsulfate kinase-like enzyme
LGGRASAGAELIAIGREGLWPSGWGIDQASAPDFVRALNVQICEDTRPMGELSATGVMITGVYGSGKSSIAKEVAYLLEQRHQPYALLDLDFLGWWCGYSDDDAAGFRLMLRNLEGVASNYRDAGISVFVVAYFVSGTQEMLGVRDAIGVPLRVVRLSASLTVIERRLAADVTTERKENLREAARQITTGEGVGVEDVVIHNDRPVGVVAQQILAWLGWL